MPGSDHVVSSGRPTHENVHHQLQFHNPEQQTTLSSTILGDIKQLFIVKFSISFVHLLQTEWLKKLNLISLNWFSSHIFFPLSKECMKNKIIMYLVLSGYT